MAASKSLSEERRAAGRKSKAALGAAGGEAGGSAAASGTAGRTQAAGPVAARAGAGGTGTDEAFLEELLAALRAARNGDFSVRLPGRRATLAGQIGAAFNGLVEMNARSNKELARVGRQVGREGRMTERMNLPEARGAWEESVSSVNNLISDLSRPTTEVARVIEAVARGDLSQKVALTIEGQPVRGEFLRIGTAVNSMVEQLSSFSAEVSRVAREVGTEGILGGQARVRGVSGTWKDLTDNVNYMASNLTSQVRNIAQVATAVAGGDLSKKITVGAKGEVAALADTINSMTDTLRAFANEVTRVAREVGTEGKLGGQAHVPGVSGTWKDLTDNVNYMASNLTSQVRNIAQVTTAVANGDLGKKISVDVRGEILELKNTINTMVDQLSSFADEVTRVAREVGTEGKLGGQANVRGVSGTWKDLTDNVNYMASNLTGQVRNIAQVATAVAGGDLTQKITVDVQGEILQLKNTINTMVDQLSSFADEVTRVAREVGTEGKLGGQAEVRGVSGTWRDLTDNVNIMASSLTTQVRAIADVATAVTQGDLSRSITVEAQGEVSELKNNINQMIGNLADTTQRSQEQDWLKTNLARISGLMQGQRDLTTVSRLIMNELTPTVSAQHGAFFLAGEGGGTDPGETVLRLIASYGYTARKNVPNQFRMGEALVGQSALERIRILVTEAPSDYVKISSGLGEADPVNIVVLPVVFEDQVLGVIELATLKAFSEVHLSFLDQVIGTIGVVLNTIIATTRTEELLEESQRLTGELQQQSAELQSQQEELRRSNAELESQAASLKASEELLQQQQEELQQTNEELQEKARLLAEQNSSIEVKNREIEMARLGLEEKAQQLALSSKYKSEFLANMSHELRTPLNSLLILAKLLSDNDQGNLDGRQVEFARTIHNSGSDLLELINDILDLSKVEAGKMDVIPVPVGLADVAERIRQSFGPLASEKELTLEIVLAAGTPESMVTDEQRLHQILRNLMSNAVKFTEKGSVRLTISEAPAEIRYAHPALSAARSVLAFTVTDTGVGIPPDKLRLVFEAFQQADGTTSRRYGGTGLGLSISREIARLLGGEIRLESKVGEGSTFTLFLPAAHPAADGPVPVVETPTDAAPAPPAAVPVDPDHLTPVPGDPADDRGDVKPGDRVMLVITGDIGLARDALDVSRSTGFKAVVTTRAGTAVALAREHRPDAILLDTELPYAEGSALLAHFKQDPDLRHIPVHVVSGPHRRQESLRLGAFGFSSQPLAPEGLSSAISDLATFVDRPTRTVLVVEDDEADRRAVAALLSAGDGVEVVAAADAEEAESVLAGRPVDCMVLDLKLPRSSGFGLLERIKSDERLNRIPVIIYTGKDLTRREETRLSKYAETIIVKDARSPERLLAETTLFLHQPPSRLPQDQRLLLEQLHTGTDALQGKQVLIVDDDVRNVFALTSVLERHGMQVLFAENGREGLATLKAHPETDLVLMDIMMPEMDGYETMTEIRKVPALRKLPIIALTAKAMKGDRERSIEAGASDYITKPVDVGQLVSLMRVWLYS